MKAVVVVGVLLVSTSAVAAPSAKVEPPPGWIQEENPVLAERLAEVRKLPDMVRIEARTWVSPERDASLQVLEAEANRNNTDFAELIDQAEVGAKSGAKSARQVSLRRSEHGNAVVVDHVVEDEALRLHHRRHYAADDGENFHSVHVTCVGPVGVDVPACQAAFASFAWNFEPVSRARARQHDVAYRIGQFIGYGALVALFVWLVVRSMRKKPS